MRRITITGICLVAAFALTALAAASASAALPEIYECHKQTGGKYTEKKCTKEASGKTAGKYELGPWGSLSGAKKGKEIKGTSKAAALHAGGTEIKCKSSTSTAYLTGPKTEGEVNVAFKGCEALGHPCNSITPKGKSGEIKTKELQGKLGFLEGKSPEVGIDVSPASGKFLAEFECAGLIVEVEGSAIGTVTPTNTWTKTSDQTFEENGKEEQKDQQLEGESPDHLETTIKALSISKESSAQVEVNAAKGSEELYLKA
jgi:hypothetical protein